MGLAVGAQQAERVRRIGVLLPAGADDSQYQARSGRSCKGWGHWLDDRPQRANRHPLGRAMPTTFADAA
jgi:hypothetical protein